MQMYQESLTTSSSPGMIAVVLSPLCTLIPTLLRACFATLSSIKDEEGGRERKTRFLRSVSGFHQMISIMLDQSGVDATTRRIIEDRLTDELVWTRKT